MPFQMSGGTAPDSLVPGWYVAQVQTIADGAVGEYGPTMNWRWSVWDDAGVQLVDDAGALWDLQVMSSDKLSRGKNVAKARLWAEALLGDGVASMAAEQIAKSMIGASCWVEIIVNDKGYADINDVRPMEQAAAVAPTDPGSAAPGAAPPVTASQPALTAPPVAAPADPAAAPAPPAAAATPAPPAAATMPAPPPPAARPF